jgi:DNA-directed RNA polymerase subunit alpha
MFISSMCVGGLVQKRDHEIQRIPNFGRKTLREIKAVLGTMGLHHLGTKVRGWPPANIKRLFDGYAECQ